MTVRRILYLLLWVVSVVFFWANRQWLSWFLLVAVTCLPLFSLLVTLPAAITAHVVSSLPQVVTVGQEQAGQLTCYCHIPTPPWTCKMTIYNPMTGKRQKYKSVAFLPTDHCAMLEITFHRPRMQDYLGLFTLPMRKIPVHRMVVRPKELEVKLPADKVGSLHCNWKPKPGGGFSENHELRLYRPGDSLRQIHWKLSGKTGKLILREPMEPARQRVLLRLDLSGTTDEIDRKLGRLLWLGNWLLEQEIPFEIQCLTGVGVKTLPVNREESLLQALDTLMGCPLAKKGCIREVYAFADWQYYIGGGIDEA